MGGIFSPLSCEAACVSMWAWTVALWWPLLELVYMLLLLERGDLTLQFDCLTLACSRYHTEQCKHLTDWREAYGGSPPDSALWVCERYMVIW